MSEEKNIVEQLRGSVTVIIDHYGNRETFVAQGGIMCEAADTIERLARERDEARAENDRMRAAIANGTSACVYCSLPAEEWAKCQHGFPGCDRADDALGCPELGAKLNLAEARAALATARNDALEEAAREISNQADHYVRVAIENEGTSVGDSNKNKGGAAGRIASVIRAMKTVEGHKGRVLKYEEDNDDWMNDAVDRSIGLIDKHCAALEKARDAALEEAAKWHDEQHDNAVFNGLYIPADVGDMHACFAAAIRALKRNHVEDHEVVDVTHKGEGSNG